MAAPLWEYSKNHLHSRYTLYTMFISVVYFEGWRVRCVSLISREPSYIFSSELRLLLLLRGQGPDWGIDPDLF